MCLGFFVSLAKGALVIDLFSLVFIFLLIYLKETSLGWSPLVDTFEYVYSLFGGFVFTKEGIMRFPVYTVEDCFGPFIFFL